jgi:uroporphyrinogen-III decarboxylase
MHQTINVYGFRDAFKSMGRADQFSYDALGMLFDHLDGDHELDVIAICCAYSEDSPEYIADQYDIDVSGMDEGQTLDAVLEYLGEKTQVVGVTDAGAVVYNSEF